MPNEDQPVRTDTTEPIVIDGIHLTQALRLRNAIYEAVQRANRDIADRIFTEMWPNLANEIGMD